MIQITLTCVAASSENLGKNGKYKQEGNSNTNCIHRSIVVTYERGGKVYLNCWRRGGGTDST